MVSLLEIQADSTLEFKQTMAQFSANHQMSCLSGLIKSRKFGCQKDQLTGPNGRCSPEKAPKAPKNDYLCFVFELNELRFEHIKL